MLLFKFWQKAWCKEVTYISTKPQSCSNKTFLALRNSYTSLLSWSLMSSPRLIVTTIWWAKKNQTRVSCLAFMVHKEQKMLHLSFSFCFSLEKNECSAESSVWRSQYSYLQMQQISHKEIYLQSCCSSDVCRLPIVLHLQHINSVHKQRESLSWVFFNVDCQ